MSICLVLHMLLRTVSLLLNQTSEHIAIGNPGCQICNRAIWGVQNTEVPRGVAIQYLKWSEAQCSMVGCSVPILGQWDPLVPLFGTGVYTTAKKGFKAFVESFCLPISLGVVGRTEIQFHAHGFMQAFPKLRGVDTRF